MRSLALVLALCPILPLTGCGGRELVAQEDGGPGNANPNPSPNPSPTPIPTPTPPPPPPPPPPTGATGYVLLANANAGGGTVASVVEADFLANASPSCFDFPAFGVCAIRACPDLGKVPGTSAGTVSVTGGSQAVTLPPTSSSPSGYTPVFSSQVLFSPGQVLVVSASGASVPPFAMKLPFPSAVAVSAPIIQPSVKIDTSVDLSLGFKGAPGQVVAFVLSSQNTSGSALICSYDAGAGGGVVPASWLKAFLAANGPSASVGVAAVNSVAIQIDGWRIVADAIGEGPSGEATLR